MKRHFKTKYPGVFFEPSKERKHHGRPDQVWWILIKVGKRLVWEKVGWASEGFTAARASQIRAERAKALREKKLGVGPALTIPTFREAFKIAYDRSFKHLSVAEKYLAFTRTHLEGLSEKPLDAITARDLEAIDGEMMTLGRSPSTIKHAIGMVNRVYVLMAKWEVYVGPSPAAGFDYPRHDNKRERYLTREEANALLEALKKRSDYVWRLAMASLFTGMRRGEIVKLKGEHVNLGAKTIHVVDTKTGKNRVVYIPGPLYSMMSGMEIKPGLPVFPRPRQGQNDVNAVNGVFAGTVKDLGLNEGITDPRHKVVFHTLRHTFASWLVSQGQPLYTVSTLLGHTTSQMTQRYSHLMPETKKAAMETLENFFNPAENSSEPGKSQ
jgi:integrase